MGAGPRAYSGGDFALSGSRSTDEGALSAIERSHRRSASSRSISSWLFLKISDEKYAWNNSRCI
jgi:hypothetical protein